jgi:DNA-binding LacI/PurR family transcriptional regulator
MSVMQGLRVLEEARRRGLHIPRDISVVGYNDIWEAAVSVPPLTTVNGMGVEKGRAAAKAIFGGGLPRHEILQPYLILRDSTGPAPA